MLSYDDIQAILGDALHDLYEPATLEIWEMGDTRDPTTGTFTMTKTAEKAVRAQVDSCTEEQRGDPGYAPEDVRLLILQHDIDAAPTRDCRVRHGGVTWRIMTIAQDPARAYWDMRARAV